MTNKTQTICINFIVSGKVQGVFYRHSTQVKAEQLGLTGWVKNLPNGDVELIACGTEQQIEQIEKWLWQGPPAAQVNNVVRKKISTELHDEFVVKRD